MQHVASLPMYDLPELRAHTDALWSAIAAELRRAGHDAPATLTRGVPLDDLWRDPALLLSQTCGYPLVKTHAQHVTLLATPCYDARGCNGAEYSSAVVVRAADNAMRLSDLRGRRCAVNDMSSNSGMNVLRAAIAPLAQDGCFFAGTVVTGAHSASVRAVADGRADVAAIDCISWAHLQHLRPAETNSLRVLCWTPSSPGLPLITSRHTDAATCSAVLQALDRAATSAAMAPVRKALRVSGFARLPLSAYDAILALEEQARARCYPTLR